MWIWLSRVQIPLATPFLQGIAAPDHAALVKELPPGITAKDLLECWRARNGFAVEKRTVRQVVDELTIAKKGANVSKVYLNDLQSRLDRFADDFQMNIGDVTGKMIQTWLDGLKRLNKGKTEKPLNGRTKRNYSQSVASYCQDAHLSEIEAPVALPPYFAWWPCASTSAGSLNIRVHQC